MKDSFPLPNTNIYRLLHDLAYRATFNARLKTGNRWMALFVKTGLLGLMRPEVPVMILTTLGRKSQQLREAPIGYCRVGGTIHVFSGWGKEANWYKNIAACPDMVYVPTGRQRVRAHAQVVNDPLELQGIYERLVIESPRSAHEFMGWDAKVHHLEMADFAPMIEKVLVVRFDTAT